MKPGPEEEFRSAFVAVVGRPNVGKSTLVNALVGRKVAITSPTPQTTRHRIAGIVNRPGLQLVLLDLPGFQRPLDLLTRRMQRAVDETLGEVDQIWLMLNAAERIGPGDRYVAARSFAAGTPVIIVLNKVDLVPRPKLLPQMEQAASLGDFHELFPVSALEGEGLSGLLEAAAALAEPGPRYFPEDAASDQPERVLAAELVREQVLRLTREEVPHSVAVYVESMEPRRGGELLVVRAVIIVERQSQKGIIVGRKGSMIKEIGSRARREMELLLGSKVFLDLTVKVRRKWREDARRLDELGL